MKNIKDIKQLELFDSWGHISSQKRSILDSSWPGLFQKEILPVLPVHKFGSFYSKSRGRKSKELYAMLGTLVLQQQFDLTDEETVAHYIFDERWHYALNRYDDSKNSEYMCYKTLWSVRNKASINDFDLIIFKAVADRLATVFSVNTVFQRLDSVHIKSNMRKLSRVTLCSNAIRKFIKNLKRKDKELLVHIDKKLLERYLPQKGFQCFAMVKPSEAQKTLVVVSKDLYTLIKQFKNIEGVPSMRTYKLLERILTEQFIVKESDNKETIEIKAPKEVASDSLQNPSDPDATYSGHKGQGYQVQVMETVCKDKDKKAETLNLITHVKVEQAHESDAHALMPAIESTEKRGLKPKKLAADEAYGSDTNCESAKKHDVDVISPAKGSAKKNSNSLIDFKIYANGKVKLCPKGKTPVHTHKKKRFSAAFDLKVCGSCPDCSNCIVQKGKNYFYLRYTKKELRLALRRKHERSSEFKEDYRLRSGVEATMAQFDRRTGVKNLKVRGFRAVRFAATLKAAGLNILRAAAVRKGRKKATAVAKNGNLALKQLISLILSVKEHLKPIFCRFQKKLA